MDAVFDKAQENQLEEVEHLVSVASQAVKNQTVTGICRNPHCGEHVPGRNFCDSHCRDDYERLMKLARINGNPIFGGNYG